MALRIHLVLLVAWEKDIELLLEYVKKGDLYLYRHYFLWFISLNSNKIIL